MEEMWSELERYQPYADRRGFGAEWKQMTTERTQIAAMEAKHCATVAAAAAAASRAAAALEDFANASRWAEIAIFRVREAIAKEEPL